MQRKIVFREEYINKYKKPKVKVQMPMITSYPQDGKPIKVFDTIEQTLDVASLLVGDNNKLSKAINLGKELLKIFRL